MFPSTLLLLLAATSSLVSALSSTTTGSAATSSSSPIVIKVSSSSGAIVYTPDTVTAAVGSSVEFRFESGNHSVVQSSFEKPCEPLSGSASIFSGFMFVGSGVTDLPTFTIKISDTKPIWFYCSQLKHCQSGMSGVINPPTDKTLKAYRAAALSAPANLSPSGGPSGGAAGTMGGSSTATAAATYATTTATTTAPVRPTTSSSAADAVRVGGWVLAAVAVVGGVFVI